MSLYIQCNTVSVGYQYRVKCHKTTLRTLVIIAEIKQRKVTWPSQLIEEEIDIDNMTSVLCIYKYIAPTFYGTKHIIQATLLWGEKIKKPCTRP